jgi:hypothetical protein
VPLRRAARVAHDRLAWTADGRISNQLERPWPDGRTDLVLEPVAFLRRLVGIILAATRCASSRRP